MPSPVKLTRVIPNTARVFAPKQFSSDVAMHWRVQASPASEGGSGVYEIRGHRLNPVSDQGGEGSCVANAICDGLEIAAIRDGRELVQLSRNALYLWSRCRHGAQFRDEGTYIPAALEQCKIVGVIPESEWPYVASRVNKAPTNDEILLASDNRVEGFYELTETDPQALASSLVITLNADQPVVFWMRLGQEYRNPPALVQKPTTRWGLHAQLIVGYRLRDGGLPDFLVRNSWGDDWGEGGYAWVAGDYITDTDLAGDFYAFTTSLELVLP